jgi:hypothetical protein
MTFDSALIPCISNLGLEQGCLSLDWNYVLLTLVMHADWCHLDRGIRSFVRYFSSSLQSITYQCSGTKFLTAFQSHRENGSISTNFQRRCGTLLSLFAFIPNLVDNHPTTPLQSSFVEGDVVWRISAMPSIRKLLSKWSSECQRWDFLINSRSWWHDQCCCMGCECQAFSRSKGWAGSYLRRRGR